MESANTQVKDDGAESCGLGLWKPQCLQRYASPKSFLFWLCWAGACQSLLVNGLINVSVSTIEKRYEFTSTDSGFIVGAYDIASFLFVLPISYFGGQIGTCKPRWIGVGIILLGIGSFIFAIPHFVSGLYQASEEKNDTVYCASSILLADLNETISYKQPSSSASSAASLQNFKYVFFVAQLLMGIGAAPLYTLGITFLDDNVSHKMQPVYSGVFYAITTLGPALGFSLGGQLLRIYVDFLTVSSADVGITPGSSAWVGAWWIGFVICGILLGVAAIPLFAFPSKLKGSEAIAADKEMPIHSKNESKIDQPQNAAGEQSISFKESLRELPLAVKKLALNYTFLLISLEESCETIILAGFGAFLPKIIESQFTVSSATAALILGGLVVPCGCGGAFMGGFLIKHFKMTCEGILKCSVLLIGISFVFSFAFLIYCPNIGFAGVNKPYYDREDGPLSLNSKCNSNCSCSLDTYDPVCGVDNIFYYSPCYAGCTNTHGSGSKTMYSDCACIVPNGTLDATTNAGNFTAIRQKCKSTCNNIYGFIAVLFVFLSFTVMNSMPPLAATLRCTDPDQRTFALGVQMIIWRLLGSIPGPVIFGLAIDNACSLWQTTNGGVGSCQVYDNYSFSRAMATLAFVGKGLAFVFAVLAWKVYSPPKDPKVDPAQEMHAYDNATLDSS